MNRKCGNSLPRVQRLWNTAATSCAKNAIRCGSCACAAPSTARGNCASFLISASSASSDSKLRFAQASEDAQDRYRESLPRLGQHRTRPRVRVLHVEYRVVVRLLEHFVEDRNRASRRFCGKHHEADGPRPTSSTTSRSVTNEPERFDILSGSPPRKRRTI